LKKFLLSLLVFFLSSNVFADKIESILLKGNETISRGTILSYLPFEVGDEFSEDISNLTIKELFKTGFFKDVLISSEKNTIVLNVVENPTIKYFDFQNYDEGSDVLSPELIEEILKNFNLSIGDIYSEKLISDLINELKNLYISKGFYAIEIKDNLELDSNNRIGIELDISEGERSLIESFQINGNTYFDSDELLKQFEIGEPDFLIINYFTKKDQFSQNSFDAGVENLVKKYVEEGFLDFEISKKDINFDKEQNKVNIVITVNEGTQYKISDILFEGGVENDYINLKQILLTKKGDLVKRKKILLDIKNVNRFYTDKGYAFAKVNSTFVPKNNKEELDIILSIDLGEKYYINRIIISGNTRTQDSVIRRELNINEGQIYSKTDLDESIKRVKRLGFFSNVESSIKKLEVSNSINFLINVEETKTGQFAVGLSHSNSSGASLIGSIRQNNILGTGNTFNAEFRNSKAAEEMSFFFSDPYYKNSRNRISYGAFTKSLDASGLDLSSYLIDENGINFGLGIPISDTESINSEIRLSSMNVTCGAVFASADYEAKQCASNDKIDNNISISYIDNTLDDFFMPTEGNKTSIKLTSTTPLSEFKYISLDASYKKYVPLSSELTFNHTARLNLATGYDGKSLPFFKRYYGGGSSSVRGFDFNSLGAKYSNGTAKGGESSVLSSVSIITPAKTFGIDQENIRLATFIDAGSVNEKLSDFNIDDIRATTGVALSWLTPIGPIGFNAATALLSKNNDNIENFTFELGTSF